MIFTTTAAALRDGLAQIRPFVPSSPSLSSYAGVLVRTDEDGALSLTGSDGESSLTVEVPATEVTAGQVLLTPKPITSYLATIDDARKIIVELTGADVKVTPEGLTGYTFRPIPATYPAPAAPSGTAHPIDPIALAAAVAAVRPAVNRETLAVQVSSDSGALVLHTTDGYRLARAAVPGAGFGDFSGVLSVQTLERAARLGASSVIVDTRSRLLLFQAPAAAMTVRPLATPFPAVDAVIEAAPPSVTSLAPKALATALARLSSVADQSPVRIRLDGYEMALSVSTAEIGAGSETVALLAPVPAPFEVLVRSSYIQEAIAVFNTDAVTLAYSGAVQPLFLSAASPVEMLHVVMPVRA